MGEKLDKPAYPSVSLFTGAYGLDLGLEKAGFYSKVCVEKDPVCVETIKINRPRLKDQIINKDINDLSAIEILNVAGLKKGEASLVSGGPPCQPFSTVGRRESISSDEGQLFNKFLEVVWGIYPKYFIFENVKGILSAAIQHKPLKDRNQPGKTIDDNQKLGSGWDFINRQFKEKLRTGKKGGYHLNVWELDASDFGVAQKRKRVFIIGSRINEVIQKPKDQNSKKGKTLKDIIGKLNGDYELPGVHYYQYDKTRYDIFKSGLVKEGQNWTVLPKRLQKKVMGKGWYSTGGRVGFCRRLTWGKPSPTITTSPIGRATNLCHPDKPRPLNYIECALLQGFPKSWKFSGSLSKKYKQIGNAVPIKLATVIGKAIINA